MVYKSERDFLTKLYNRSAVEKRFSEYAASASGTDCLPSSAWIWTGSRMSTIRWGILRATGCCNWSHVSWSRVSVWTTLWPLGRDEFIALMYGVSTREIIERKAEELCARIRSIRMAHPRYSGVSVSIGVAIAPEHGDSFEELYAKADVALYHAKQGGRDRFVIYGGE